MLELRDEEAVARDASEYNAVEPDADDNTLAGEADDDSATPHPGWMGESEEFDALLQSMAQSGPLATEGDDATGRPDPQEVPRLALQLGIDLHEDIPGMASSRELQEQPDSTELLRRWVAGE